MGGEHHLQHFGQVLEQVEAVGDPGLRRGRLCTASGAPLRAPLA
jgi:hypothetical protein